MEKNYDFSGWATKANLKCSDGRMIMKDAFKEQDGQTVPLVWNHQHNDPDNVLGHAVLENRNDGVYAYCVFNDTPAGKKAKLLVEHGDVTALSIFANKLKQHGAAVLHGIIREVSLVLAGANPGAFIDDVINHGEKSEDSAVIFTGEEIELYHSDEKSEEKETKPTPPSTEPNKEKREESEMENKKEGKTVQEVVDSMTEEQKNVMYALVGQALEENEADEENDKNQGDENNMKHNVFENDETIPGGDVLSHAEQMEIINDWKRYGSLKESALQHGIEKIEYLFPDNKNVTTTPVMIDRDQAWVGKVMASVHRTPFSRIKSTLANITADEARAKGYTKGKKKIDEVFSLLKRTTDPTTVYKKQTIDRDDVVDITDFDVIAWIKSEMRGKLDEELARAFLIGDGRLASSNDKIDQSKIRPIWTDDELYTIAALVVATDADTRAKEFIKACIKARKNYKGSGNPSLYTTEDMLTDCLLLTDSTGRDIYESVEKLATKLRVKEIITVPVMESKTRTVGGKERELLGIIVNLADYNVGADKGGAVNMFDDFDIDYNQQKYLIETRCSGALVKPYSAIVIEASATGEASGSEE